MKTTIAIAPGRVVNRLGFGGYQLSGQGHWGPPADPVEARALLHRALELGVTFIDTADTYGGSEETIAQVLHPYRSELVIATKGGLERDGPEIGPFKPWRRNGSPEQLRRACESSLRRLRLEQIELYQLHSPDPKVPLAESVGALKELRDEGKVKHVGVCNVSCAQLDEAREIVELVSVQNEYSVLNRTHEPVLEACERYGLAFIPWFPLGGGEIDSPPDPLERVAARHGCAWAQVALAWLLWRSGQTLPIPGTRSIAHLEQNMEASTLELTPEDLSELDLQTARGV